MLDVKGKKIVLVGHYGSGNYGDDMMLQALINEYSGRAASVTVVFFNNQTSGIDLRGGRSVLIKRVNKLKMLLEWIRVLWVNDLIVWGGGTCFTDEEGDGFFIGMMVAGFFGKSFAYKSVGIGNLEKFSRKVKTRLLLTFCAYVSFREEQSIAAAVKLLGDKEKYREFEDDLGARYLSELSPEDWVLAESEPYIVVAWRDLAVYQGGHQIDKLFFFLNSLVGSIARKVVILDVDNLVDSEINDLIEDGLNRHLGLNVVRRKGLSFSEKNAIIANAAAIVTARLHVGIAAVNFAVPVYIYPYSPKINYAFSNCNVNTHVLDFTSPMGV